MPGVIGSKKNASALTFSASFTIPSGSRSTLVTAFDTHCGLIELLTFVILSDSTILQTSA